MAQRRVVLKRFAGGHFMRHQVQTACDVLGVAFLQPERLVQPHMIEEHGMVIPGGADQVGGQKVVGETQKINRHLRR